MSRPLTATDLPEDIARVVEAQLAAGNFANVEDVLRASVQALELQAKLKAQKLQALQAALEEGERSGVFEGDPFASVRAELGLKQR